MNLLQKVVPILVGNAALYYFGGVHDMKTHLFALGGAVALPIIYEKVKGKSINPNRAYMTKYTESSGFVIGAYLGGVRRLTILYGVGGVLVGKLVFATALAGVALASYG